MTNKVEWMKIEKACSLLRVAARRHVDSGMGPRSAALAAIAETKESFPQDWRLVVQGDDDEDIVEVWEVDHKYSAPIAGVEASEGK